MSLRTLSALGIAIAALSLTACFDSQTVECSGGVICPAGSVCTADGLGCVSATGCGDMIVGPGEECDDGNQVDTDDCKADCTINVCGDGSLDMQGDRTDTCDDDNFSNSDNCVEVLPVVDADGVTRGQCRPAVCGDGHRDEQGDGVNDRIEACDNGNTSSNDGCKDDCSSTEACGNDIEDTHLDGTVNCNNATATGTNCPEVCDDNNTVAGDGCSANCLSNEECGNGIKDEYNGPNDPEACDDGDPNDPACSDDCQSGVGCGNGLVEDIVFPEQCDNGMVGVNTADCDDNCTFPVCGDNLLNMPAGEDCDPGTPFTNTNSCNFDCTVPACGDGIINRAFTPMGGTVTEQCDDGGTDPGDGCSATCQIETCGNGVTEMINGEQCDDGNTNDLDGCRNNCQSPRCGDGVASMSEACDTNGNSQTCNADCTVPACGDGKVNTMFTPTGGTAPEACDDGGTAPGDGCSALCRIETCGNGITEMVNGEECDDGNTTDTDNCRNNCQAARCGDGVVDVQAPGIEACDTVVNTAGCDSDCTVPMCNDTIVNAPAGEQCEDGNTAPGDGCSPTCRLEPFPMTVTKTGTGTGTVTSSPAGINCGGDCSELYLPGTMVTLTAAPDANSTFNGWSGGGCTGTAPCAVTMDAAKTVTATFMLNTLTVSKAGTGGGTVSSSPAGITCGGDCDQTYNTGTVVTLTAAPDSTSTFTGWSGGGCSGTGTCVITLNAATAVTATFTLQTFTLTVTKSGTGTGTVTSGPVGIDCGSTCMFGFTANTMVTLTATPDANSTFTGWSGSGCSGTGQCVVPMTMARSVNAQFTIRQFTLTVVREGSGTGTVTSAPAGINCGSDCSEMYNAGTMVTLTAVAGSGDAFTGWSGGGCTGTGTCVVTVNGATSVTANFADNRLTVVRTGDGVGTVTSVPSGINCGNDCSQDYNTGTAVTLTAAAGSGARFSQWTTGPCMGSTLNTCLVTVSGPVTVTAEFLDVHVLTLNKGAGSGVGSVTSSPAGIDCNDGCSSDTGTYDEDTVVTLSAIAGPASYFIGWSGSGCSGTGTCVVTMSAARTVTANFGETFVLTVTPAGTGTGTVQSAPGGINCGADCTEAYIDGTVVTLTASPTGGSTFMGWSGSGCSGTGTCVVTMSNTRNVTATFNPPPMFALNVTVTGTGTVSSSPAGITACAAAAGDCTESYTSGTMVTLTASANTTWTGCAMMTMTTCNVTMDMMRAVTATFP